MAFRLTIDRILITGALLLLFSLIIVFISIFQSGISTAGLYTLLYLLAAVLILFIFLFQKIMVDYVAKRKTAGLLLSGENQILEKIALNDPLTEILEKIVVNIENSSKGSLCSILLLDENGTCLKTGAAPNIPPAYSAAIDGILIREKAGSCGTAAFRKETVIVADITTSELWTDYKDLALQNDLRACWSVPILSSGNHILGTFAMYYAKPQVPGPEDFDIITRAANLVKIAIEKNKAATELSKSEEKYRTLVEQASDAIFIADTNGRFVTVNTSAIKISGYTEEELMQMNIYDFAVPEDIQKNPFRLHELKDGRTINMERVMKGKGNSLFHVEVTSKLMTDGRLFAIVRNISERKKAELALKQSEEKYRTLVEQASDAIFIADAQGRFITVNNSAQKLSLYTPEELMQMTFYDFVVAEDVQKHPLQLEVLRQGKTASSERIMKRKDGSLVDIEITAKMLSDGRLLAFVRDISERKKASAELIKEKILSDSIINSLPGVFYLYTYEGNFLRWNKNFEDFTGYTAADILQMHPLDLFEGEEKVRMQNMINHVFNVGEGGVEAVATVKSKKKIPYYLTGKTISYEGKNCLMGLGINISQRVKAQEEIKETSEKLRQLTAHLQNIREEERKRIAREIHDELGQQLTAIKMDVAWVDKKIPDETLQLKNKLKNIITLLDASNSSIHKILNELRIGVLDHHGLLEALQWQGQQFSYNTGIPLDINCPDTTIEINETIATCIFRVFQEALTNVTRYAMASHVSTSLFMKDGMICFSISDDGAGFDTELLKTNKSFGILGMKERVASVNGKFELASVKENGTTITITIPYHP
jgi:PAS domain S-box-containing protein